MDAPNLDTDSNRFMPFTDPVDQSRWNVDIGFMASSWTCIWDRGCAGIEDSLDIAGGLGCCSVGAEILDTDEAMQITALAATLDPATFQQHEQAATGGVLNEAKTNTKVIDGACIFLNRPGFVGGHGCALHIAAVSSDEDPHEWKPSICWQLPLKVDHNEDGSRTLRGWRRSDWGAGGETMAWCCTTDREPNAFVGEVPVAVSLRSEIGALVGPDVAAAIRNSCA